MFAAVAVVRTTVTIAVRVAAAAAETASLRIVAARRSECAPSGAKTVDRGTAVTIRTDRTVAAGAAAVVAVTMSLPCTVAADMAVDMEAVDIGRRCTRGKLIGMVFIKPNAVDKTVCLYSI